MRKKVGVVADDITGANDIGIMFAKNGYATGIYSYDENMEIADAEDLDVIIVDTNSRFDKPDTAWDKVYKATKKLMELPCDVYHNKTCSVFRGNIGAEFDAMQEALGIQSSMVILGFPKNGRTTIDGIHYVNGVLLENSQFNRDPIHPMKESGLVDILSKQTSKKVASLNHKVLDKGVEGIREEIKSLKKDYNYIIFDVRGQQDLAVIAEAIKDEVNICGSSAIGEELPKAWGGHSSSALTSGIHKVQDDKGVLISAGSLTPQTFAQVEYLKKKGYNCIEFETRHIYDENLLRAEIDEIINVASDNIDAGTDVVIHTSNDQKAIEETKSEGYNRGLDDGEIGKIISTALSTIVKAVRKNTDFKKLVVAGGDTSAAISEALGIRKMVIIGEIEPGVPNMYGYSSGEEILMVLKSGSFGSEAFLEKAADSLKKLT